MSPTVCDGPDFVSRILDEFQHMNNQSLHTYVNNHYSYEEQVYMLQQLQNCSLCIIHRCRFPGRYSIDSIRKRTQSEKDNASCKQFFRSFARILEENIRIYHEIFGTI